MRFTTKYFRLITLLALSLTCGNGFGQIEEAGRTAQVGNQVLDSMVTILVETDGQARAAGSGVIVRSDGLLMTAYHIVRDADVCKSVTQCETYDGAEVVAHTTLNIALLRIPASGLQPLQLRGTEEGLVGSLVFIASGMANESGRFSAGQLSSVSIADEINGAGSGYRVLRFTAHLATNSPGALLIDERGRGVGLLAAFPQSENQSYAIPFSSVLGLARATGGNNAPLISTLGSLVLTPATASPTPIPIPQRDVLVPQRPVSPLTPRGPGSVVVKPRVQVTCWRHRKRFCHSPTVTQDRTSSRFRKNRVWTTGLSFVDDHKSLICSDN